MIGILIGRSSGVQSGTSGASANQTTRQSTTLTNTVPTSIILTNKSAHRNGETADYEQRETVFARETIGDQRGKVTARRSTNAFTILTVLTGGVIVSWTPILCYYTVTIWVQIDNPVYLQVAIVLFAMQSVVDPILFAWTLPDLRDTFRKLLYKR